MIVPYMSDALTTRLLNALQPLFDQRQKRGATRKLRSSLHCILSLAVQIRSESLVGTENYESVWPSTGSLFDQNEMETRHAGSLNSANIVRLPLCPGFRAYPKRKEIVGYHGLGNGQWPHISPMYVIKAMVLC
jgi:hypothetical protein